MKKCTFIETWNNNDGAKSIEDIKSAVIDKNNIVMITSKYIFIKRDGYCETLTDDNDNKIEMCFRKTKSSWSSWKATEKTTGLIVCYGTTRKGCYNELCDDYLNKIQVRLNSEVLNEIKSEMQKAYELLENKN